jgi:hypothetical protein
MNTLIRLILVSWVVALVLMAQWELRVEAGRNHSEENSSNNPFQCTAESCSNSEPCDADFLFYNFNIEESPKACRLRQIPPELFVSAQVGFLSVPIVAGSLVGIGTVGFSNITLQPRGHSAWHRHNGMELSQVIEGVLSAYITQRDGSVRKYTRYPGEFLLTPFGSMIFTFNEQRDEVTRFTGTTIQTGAIQSPVPPPAVAAGNVYEVKRTDLNQCCSVREEGEHDNRRN